MSDTLETKAVEILDKVTVAIADAAKPAAEAVLTAVWFDGVTNLLAVAASAGVMAVGIAICSKSIKAWIAAEAVMTAYYEDPRATKRPRDETTKHFACSLVSGAFTFIAFLPFSINAFSAYTWAALFNPPAALALKILNGLS